MTESKTVFWDWMRQIAVCCNTLYCCHSPATMYVHVHVTEEHVQSIIAYIISSGLIWYSYGVLQANLAAPQMHVRKAFRIDLSIIFHTVGILWYNHVQCTYVLTIMSISLLQLRHLQAQTVQAISLSASLPVSVSP